MGCLRHGLQPRGILRLQGEEFADRRVPALHPGWRCVAVSADAGASAVAPTTGFAVSGSAPGARRRSMRVRPVACVPWVGSPCIPLRDDMADRLPADRMPPDPLSASVVLAPASTAAALASSARAMAQMKPDSSRSTAVMATTSGLPARHSERYRPVSRTCAFQAMSRTTGGAALTLASLSRPTRGGCR
jgi:hypothetical protein